MKEDSEKASIRQELSQMTFEELQQLKEKIGTKMFNNAVLEKGKKKTQVFQRANKNRPREESAKIPVSRRREVIHVEKRITRDPRFDSLSGTFNEKIFKHSYSFLKDIKAHEKEHLMQEIEKETEPETKEKLKMTLRKVENQEREEKAKAEKELKAAELRKEHVERLKQGQKPHFPNKSTLRNVQLAEKFLELKKTNKLDKYLIRKRKKIAQRERKRNKR